MSHRKTWLATLLWNALIFIFVYLFLGETKLFHSEHPMSKPSISFLELPRWFDVWGAQCIVLKDGMFTAQQGHKHSSGPGLLWICEQLTQGQQRRKSSPAPVLTQRSFVFPLSTLCILHRKQTKHSSNGKYCDGSQRCFLFRHAG